MSSYERKDHSRSPSNALAPFTSIHTPTISKKTDSIALSRHMYSHCASVHPRPQETTTLRGMREKEYKYSGVHITVSSRSVRSLAHHISLFQQRENQTLTISPGRHLCFNLLSKHRYLLPANLAFVAVAFVVCFIASRLKRPKEIRE
jgi:hypothetical protein